VDRSFASDDSGVLMIGLSRKSVGLDQRCRQSIEKFHNRLSSFISGFIFLSTSGPLRIINLMS